MKLIIAIVRDIDSEAVSHALTSANFRVTGVASSGGFLPKAGPPVEWRRGWTG